MIDYFHEMNDEMKVDILEALFDVVCMKDSWGYWVKMNESAENIMQYNKLMLLGKHDRDLSREYPQFKEFFENIRLTDELTWSNGKLSRFEEQIYDEFGEYKIYEIVKVPSYHPDGSRKSLMLLGQDVTNRRNNEQVLISKIKELADFKFALDQSSIVAITDHRGIITYVNDKFCEISKYQRDELIGNTHSILNSGYHPKKFFEDMWNTIRNGMVWTGEIRNHAKDGFPYWVNTTIVPFVDREGEPYQYIAIRQDITDQIESEKLILHRAYHDELTGLRNRRYFNDEMNKWIEENKDNHQLVLLFMDLNRFKYINDTLGHSMGDLILKDVSKRMLNHLNGKAELYRFAGDEFLIVMKNGSAKDIKEIAAEISALFLEPFFLDKERIYVNASMGVSLYPQDGEDIDTLVKKADSAMYFAKKSGSHDVHFYSFEMYETMIHSMELERALRQAVEEKDFTLHYQPQVELRSNQIIGVEALIRWQHPTLGNIPPAEFIPLAEETGLITPITEWVLETACRQNMIWQQSGVSPLRIGVNISPYVFRKGLVEMVKQVLKETKLDPALLELEITESLMQNPELNIPILKELKTLGLRLSIDDFGTGYSSLAYISHFPIDSLKIDRSFIEEIQKDEGVIVKTIIDMATHLNVSVIAEGIEYEDQLDFLSQLNCSEGQGYFFSRPLPNAKLLELLPKKQ